MAEINFNIGLVNDEVVRGAISGDARVSDLRSEARSYFNLHYDSSPNHESDVSVKGDSLMLINVTRDVVMGTGLIDEWLDEGDEVRVVPEQFAGNKTGGGGSG